MYLLDNRELQNEGSDTSIGPSLPPHFGALGSILRISIPNI